MNLFKVTLLASSLALLSACGGSDKIDGSTEAKFSASMTSISQNIDIARKDEFDRSLSVVRSSYGSDRAGMAKALDGKDADAVIALSAQISKAQAEKELADAKAAQAVHLEKAKAELADRKHRYEELKSTRLAANPNDDNPSKLEMLIGDNLKRDEREVRNLEKMTPEQYKSADKNGIGFMEL
jgi:hypothetical protein